MTEKQVFHEPRSAKERSPHETENLPGLLGMPKNPEMLLVTGITGHSGRLFAGRLARERYPGVLRCALRPASDPGFLDKTALNCSTVAGDITDPEFLDGIMPGVDTVLHLAGIQLSGKIVAAAIRNNVRWVILVHTTGRYSRFKSAAAEYISIEDDILGLRNKIAITVLRPTMIYGSSRDRNMFKLVDYLYRHKFFPIFGSGKNLMQPVLAQDLANAYYGVLMNPEITVNREYNLSGKESISYLDLVRTVSRALGRRNVMVPVPMAKPPGCQGLQRSLPAVADQRRAGHAHERRQSLPP